MVTVTFAGDPDSPHYVLAEGEIEPVTRFALQAAGRGREVWIQIEEQPPMGMGPIS